MKVPAVWRVRTVYIQVRGASTWHSKKAQASDWGESQPAKAAKDVSPIKQRRAHCLPVRSEDSEQTDIGDMSRSFQLYPCTVDSDTHRHTLTLTHSPQGPVEGTWGLTLHSAPAAHAIMSRCVRTSFST